MCPSPTRFMHEHIQHPNGKLHAIDLIHNFLIKSAVEKNCKSKEKDRKQECILNKVDDCML